MQLRCGDKRVDLGTPVVMGVLNVTPDSFSDGGRFLDPARALAHAERMVEAGAALIDVGGESTRPGAPPVEVEEELRRVVPVLRALARTLPVPLSIDTRKPEVMRAAVDAGAGLINDVSALRAPDALAAAAASGAAVCLMHMQGEPRTMQEDPRYADVVAQVYDFLSERLQACLAAGIARERLVVDPGFGFGKTVQHNLQLLRHLRRLTELEVPVLVGLSRKSMIGTLLGRPLDERLPASLALATIAVLNGARIVRAHDVAQTVDAVRMAAAALGLSKTPDGGLGTASVSMTQ